MKILNNKYVKYIIISAFLGILLTHYLEYYETKFLSPIYNNIYYRYYKDLKIVNNKNNLVPKSRYKHLDEEVLNPVHIALSCREIALKILENNTKYILISSSEKDKIIEIANFLVHFAEIKKYDNISYAIYPYKFDYPRYNLTSPWYSGMAQGLIIETLLSAYNITDEQIYLRYAQLSGNALRVPVDSGGTANWINRDVVWFEEYASSKNTSHPFVLNGHIFALEGLYWIKKYDENFNNLYSAGLRAVKYFLPKFDKQLWSSYDLYNPITLANPGYQRLHIKQLFQLYNITNDSNFIFYARKFTLQLLLPFGAIFRLIISPHRSLVILFLLNSIITFVVIIIFFKIKLKYNRYRKRFYEQGKGN
jgi:hypothetical protein